MTEEIKTKLESEENAQGSADKNEPENLTASTSTEAEKPAETPASNGETDELKNAEDPEAKSSEANKTKTSDIDSFDDIVQVASDAAEKAADQMSQTAKSAYSYTTKAAKSAGEFAKKAAAQAAESAERNQVRTDATQAFHGLDTEPVKHWKDVAGTAWSRYLTNHVLTFLYGFVGLLAGLCILIFGFWKVALVLACTWIGIMYGRYREGDPKFVDFLKRHFEDDDE